MLTHNRFLISAVVLGCVCAAVPAARAQGDNCSPPRVLIVLDKSSSMTTGHTPDGQTKWEAARAAVESLVTAYDSRIDFGLMMFPDPTQCSPGTVSVGVGPGNAQVITSAMADAPPPSGNYTPMAESLDAAASYAPILDPTHTSYVLLVTDGWQYCLPYDIATRFDAVDSASTLFAAGVPTFVLGFGAEVDVLNNNRMAVAGGTAIEGCDPAATEATSPDLCYLQTGSQAELEAAFDEVALVVTEEICDGLDNDCDGFVDNQTPGSPASLTETVFRVCGGCTRTCGEGGWTSCEVSVECDDSDACTTGDWCIDDTCTGAPVSCDDGNPCTDDSCDAATGCAHVPNNAACNDGDACTGDDICSGGACAGRTDLCGDIVIGTLPDPEDGMPAQSVGGCGCRLAGSPGLAGMLLLGALLARRRRR